MASYWSAQMEGAAALAAYYTVCCVLVSDMSKRGHLCAVAWYYPGGTSSIKAPLLLMRRTYPTSLSQSPFVAVVRN
jgi:hypothetical protein